MGQKLQVLEMYMQGNFDTRKTHPTDKHGEMCMRVFWLSPDKSQGKEELGMLDFHMPGPSFLCLAVITIGQQLFNVYGLTKLNFTHPNI